MMNYTPLSSEKYVLQAMKQEFKQVRRQKMHQAALNVMTFFVATAIVGLVIYAYYNMPAWIETIEQTTGWEPASSFNGLYKAVKGLFSGVL